MLAAALDGSIEVAHDAFLVLDSLMDKNLQPISDKAEGLLAQMQGFRRCSGVLRPILSDCHTDLSQLGRPVSAFPSIISNWSTHQYRPSPCSGLLLCLFLPLPVLEVYRCFAV